VLGPTVLGPTLTNADVIIGATAFDGWGRRNGKSRGTPPRRLRERGSPVDAPVAR
jgi:hypothetical protein